MSENTKQHHLTTAELVVAPGESASLVTPYAAASFEIARMTTGDNALRFVGLRSADSAGHVRTLYQAAEPDEPDELRGVDFDDFMLSLIAEPEHQDDTPKCADVKRGEALRLDVWNPTAAPISVKVKFSGPEIE